MAVLHTHLSSSRCNFSLFPVSSWLPYTAHCLILLHLFCTAWKASRKNQHSLLTALFYPSSKICQPMDNVELLLIGINKQTNKAQRCEWIHFHCELENGWWATRHLSQIWLVGRKLIITEAGVKFSAERVKILTNSIIYPLKEQMFY